MARSTISSMRTCRPSRRATESTATGRRGCGGLGCRTGGSWTVWVGGSGPPMEKWRAWFSRAPSWPSLSNDSLFTSIHPDEVALREHLALHRFNHRIAVSVRLKVQSLGESEDLEVIRMGLACGRFRTDIARIAAHILALDGAVLQRTASRH